MRIFLSILFLLAPWSTDAQETVEYRVTFSGTWVSSDSSSYPESAHFTNLIGASHIPGNPIWKRGQLASPGVERVAELGATFTIANELSASSNAGISGPIVNLPSLFDLPNSTSKNISISIDKSNISLISMLAPSSDWFVGVSDLALRNNSTWVRSLTIDLHPYDAGTENGETFNLANSATSPAQPITLIGNSPFFDAKPVVGQLKFELLTSIATPPQTTQPTLTGDQSKTSITPILQLLLE